MFNFEDSRIKAQLKCCFKESNCSRLKVCGFFLCHVIIGGFLGLVVNTKCCDLTGNVEKSQYLRSNCKKTPENFVNASKCEYMVFSNFHVTVDYS